MAKKDGSPNGYLLHKGKRKQAMTLAEYQAWCDAQVKEHGVDTAREILRLHKWVAIWH